MLGILWQLALAFLIEIAKRVAERAVSAMARVRPHGLRRRVDGGGGG